MTIYRTFHLKNEIIAFTDSNGMWRVASKGSCGLRFSSFENIKKRFKSFAKISDSSLINYDLCFEEFVSQFEDGSKECDDISKEIETWEKLKNTHRDILEIEKRISTKQS